MSIVHHVSLGTNDMDRSLAFYDATLGALGYRRVMEFLPYAAAYGVDHPEFWIGRAYDQTKSSAGNGVHIGFAAKTKDEVQAFYEAALAHGGRDDGPPGPRTDYGPDYFGAFVRDPDGNKIEACIGH